MLLPTKVVPFLCLWIAAVWSECDYIEVRKYDTCKENVIEVLKEIIPKPSHKRINLPGLRWEIEWQCGNSTKWFSFLNRRLINQLRVTFDSNGNIEWNAYSCYPFNGPKKAGKSCGLGEHSAACPAHNNDSHSCVFETTKSTALGSSTTTTVRVNVRLSATILKLGVTVVDTEVSMTTQNIKIVEYEHKSYFIIPAGFLFCFFLNVTSVRDDHADTGFSWRCPSSTTYVQKRLYDTVKCSSLEKCEKSVCSQPASKPTGNSDPGSYNRGSSGGGVPVIVWILVTVFFILAIAIICCIRKTVKQFLECCRDVLIDC